MKNLKLLWLLGIGALLFAIGMFILPHYKVVKDTFLISGTAFVLVFYFKTLLQVIYSHSISPSRRVFWMIVVICVPVMGNLAYVIIQDTLSTKQVPHGLW
ncbi:MAG: PLDc N-terminal domain-containing protein [Chitinophagaceae bacterium]